MQMICQKAKDGECNEGSGGLLHCCPHLKTSSCHSHCGGLYSVPPKCVPVVPGYVRVTRDGEYRSGSFTYYYHCGNVHKVVGDEGSMWRVADIITDENDALYIDKAHCEPCEAPTESSSDTAMGRILNAAFDKEKEPEEMKKSTMICETVKTDGKCPYAWAGHCERSDPHTEGGCCDKVKCVPDGTRCTERCVPAQKEPPVIFKPGYSKIVKSIQKEPQMKYKSLKPISLKLLWAAQSDHSNAKFLDGWAYFLNYVAQNHAVYWTDQWNDRRMDRFFKEALQWAHGTAWLSFMESHGFIEREFEVFDVTVRITDAVGARSILKAVRMDLPFSLCTVSAQLARHGIKDD